MVLNVGLFVSRLTVRDREFATISRLLLVRAMSISVLWLLVLSCLVHSVGSLKDHLADAVFIADVNRVRVLLHLDPEVLSSTPPVEVNSIDPLYGRTALMRCGLDPQHNTVTVDSDCAAIAELLHKAGTNLSFVDKTGWTALSMAAVNGYSKMSAYLIDHGVPLNGQDDQGMTALMKAAGHAHLATFSLLYSRGANESIQDKIGMTALHHAANLAIGNQSFVPYLTSIVRVVNSSVADRTLDKNGRNILMYAAINGNITICEMMLAAGCNPNLQDAFGVSTSSMTRSAPLKSLLAEASVRWTERAHKEWLRTSKRKLKDL